jgi:hypothetical protein
VDAICGLRDGAVANGADPGFQPFRRDASWLAFIAVLVFTSVSRRTFSAHRALLQKRVVCRHYFWQLRARSTGHSAV